MDYDAIVLDIVIQDILSMATELKDRGCKEILFQGPGDKDDKIELGVENLVYRSCVFLSLTPSYSKGYHRFEIFPDGQLNMQYRDGDVIVTMTGDQTTIFSGDAGVGSPIVPSEQRTFLKNFRGTEEHRQLWRIFHHLAYALHNDQT